LTKLLLGIDEAKQLQHEF